MSQSPSESLSSSCYQIIFDNALEAYKRTTGKDLVSDPLFHRLESCNSPDTVLSVLRETIPESGLSGSSGERLENKLNPTVNVLCTFSSTLGGAVSLAYPPVGMIFTGIAILLSEIRARQGVIIHVIERIENVFRRIETYVELPPTTEMIDIIVKVMAEVLLLLALVTQEIKQGKLLQKLSRNVAGKSNIKDALRRLDNLTQEEHQMATAQDLRATKGVDERVRGVDDKIDVILNAIEQFRGELRQVTINVDDQKRNQLRQDLAEWLSPSDPFINYNTARDARHKDTAVWFIQSDAFKNWKESTSSKLLWIHGKPGAGKSVLTSAIIEDITAMCNEGSAYMGFFFFDYKEIRKQDTRALLSSLIVQLSNQSNSFYDILLHFHSTHQNGTQQPSVDALTECVEVILKASGDVPTYLIIDALDECPNTTGMPSPRDRVLSLVEELVNLKLPSLRLFATSRSEIDIRTSLESLTSVSNCISLHDQIGQRRDIIDYVRAVVYSDKYFRRWRNEDKELVIKSLSERADGMFRWTFCQLEALRHCFPSSLRNTLAQLPESLDETYERILQQIPKSNRAHAHRLLQCLVVAVRPLRVSELAEVLAIDFSTTLTRGTPTVNNKLRWPDQEEAVLSACSSLITIVKDRESRIVHFSHFSVKEFLTSNRLATTEVDALRDYHISLKPAHVIMAQACLAVLLYLDNSMDRETIENYPLAKYSGDHFCVHAEFDDDVLSHITDGVNDLLNPDKPHFDTWIWLQIGDWNPWSWHNAHLAQDIFSSRHPSRLSLYGAPKYPPRVAPLYYVAALGHLRLAQHLKETRPQDLRSKDDKGCAPFHIAVFAGKVEVSKLLIGRSNNLDIRDIEDHNLLHMATWKGQIDIAQVLLEHDGEKKVLVNAQNKNGQTPLHLASQHNRLSIVALLLKFGANVNVQDHEGMTPLFFAAKSARSSKIAQLLLKHGAGVDRKNKNGQVPLHLASQHVNLSNMELLLKSGATVDAQDNDGMTSLLLAAQSTRCGAAAQLLLEHGASIHVRNRNGQTPLHLASRWGLSDVVASLLTLGADVDAQDSDEMTPLLCASGPFRSIAAAQVLLNHGANVHLRNKNGQTPLHVASENHFSNVVALLLNSGAEVDALDDNIMTPLQIALSSPSRPSWKSWSSSSLEDLKKVIELLLAHGADIHFAE